MGDFFLLLITFFQGSSKIKSTLSQLKGIFMKLNLVAFMILLGVQILLIKGISIISPTEKKSENQATSQTTSIGTEKKPEPPAPKVEHKPLLTTLTGHALTVTSAAITADHNTLISGSKDNTIKLWNPESGELKRTLTGHTGVVNYLNVTPDGKYIVSADSYNVRIWNLLSGALIRQFNNSEKIGFIKTTQDGKTLVIDGGTQIIKSTKTTDSNGYKYSSEVEIKKYLIRVLNLNTGVLRNNLVHNQPLTHVAISSSGNILVSGDKTGNLNIWNLQNGRLEKTLTGHNSAINSIAISPDEKTIVSTEEDGQIKIWDLSSGKLKSTFTGHDRSYKDRVIVLITNNTLISWLQIYYNDGGDVKIWDLQTGNFKYTLNGTNFNFLKVSADAKHLITYRENGINKWELATGELKNNVKIAGDILAISPDNKIVVTSEGVNNINLWKMPFINGTNQ
ncbi:WD40 repeat domain-containing protein [Sphaerospermopsis sp. LEGE 08334]|jgi:WD40 repeat protein|nr:WD40 repeat domain-containing protein [Sphaerospermopsis sp. LEGE 08334]